MEADYIKKMERKSIFSTRSTITISASAIVMLLLTSSISVILPQVNAQTSPPAVSMNMSSQNGTTTTNNNGTNAMLASTADLGNKKSFYVFSEEMEGINETKLGIPGDVYSHSVLGANEGDAVTIHFYNLDPSDRHTLTMGAPYNINKDVGPLQNTTVTFTAEDSGVFRFYCRYHQPTMAGQLIVLPPPTVEKATPANSIITK